MEVGLTAISMLVTLNWAAGLGAVGVGVVGVGSGVKVETDVGVAPGVGVGELLLPPPQAATANNNSRQGNKAALIECLVRLKFFNIAFSWRRFCTFFVAIQDFSPPAAAHPGMEWVRAVPPAAAQHAPTPYP